MKELNLANNGPLLLLIIDCLGIGPDNDDNPIFKAKTKTLNELIAQFPSTALKISNLNLGENYKLLGNAGSDYSLSATIAEQGMSQIKIAEIEKYSYLTYFLNNKKNQAEKNEERILVKSDLVSNYGQNLEMSSPRVVAETIKAIKGGRYDFIATSLANLDLVSHLNDQELTRQAVSLVDNYVKKITKAILAKNGTLLITACRSGAEKSANKKSANFVPFIIVNKEMEGKTTLSEDMSSMFLSSMMPKADLSNVLPTILKLLKIDREIPNKSLI